MPLVYFPREHSVVVYTYRYGRICRRALMNQGFARLQLRAAYFRPGYRQTGRLIIN